jgi:hypothetical protein
VPHAAVCWCYILQPRPPVRLVLLWHQLLPSRRTYFRWGNIMLRCSYCRHHTETAAACPVNVGTHTTTAAQLLAVSLLPTKETDERCHIHRADMLL